MNTKINFKNAYSVLSLNGKKTTFCIYANNMKEAKELLKNYSNSFQENCGGLKKSNMNKSYKFSNI